MPGLAALLWIKLPGESDGTCGGETGYLFSPTQARRLTVNSPFVVAEDRQLAAAFEAPAIPGDNADRRVTINSPNPHTGLASYRLRRQSLGHPSQQFQ
jgi:cellulase/cellobiase CelA1